MIYSIVDVLIVGIGTALGIFLVYGIVKESLRK